MINPILEITVEEQAGIARNKEPVTFGLPFPEGLIIESSGIDVIDDKENYIPVATMPLAMWSDGSIKWLLIDIQLSISANRKKRLKIRSNSSSTKHNKRDNENFKPIEMHESPGKICIHTNRIEFELDDKVLLPFSQIIANGRPRLLDNASRILLTDEHGQEWIPRIESRAIEMQNPLRMVVAFEGPFISEGVVHSLRYKCRIHFYAGKATTRIDFTTWNPQAARHPGGVWDLGDPGSIFFKDLSFNFALNSKEQSIIYWKTNPTNPLNTINPPKERRASPMNSTDSNNLVIYQDSSGGENWRSHNHFNRREKIPLSFRGFEVKRGRDIISQGFRSSPFVALSNGKDFIAVTVKRFWQNFQKAIESDNGNLTVRLFPKHFNDIFELQGGEQKTHTIYICVGNEPIHSNPLDWIHEPLIPIISPEWYYASGACPMPVPLNSNSLDDYHRAYQEMIDLAINGNRSFFARREIIDEYGWRNFGEIYADHEAVFHNGKEEFVSHYNNQYDIIKGALIQFMRTGKLSWFRLADELADHVSDIDIYHTDQDRYQYNHGLFWHTDHHLNAFTSTHRCISRKHREFKDPRFVGGGPSCEHNYTTGFLYHYWITGNLRSKESVSGLADYVIRNLEGPDTILEIVAVFAKRMIKRISEKTKQRSTGYAEVYGFDGPGRCSGNALNTLLDAYLLSQDEKYLKWAENLICRCVTPKDDIGTRDLLNAEIRWFYTIFLQSLGKYLDVKRGARQLDQYFWYGRIVLLMYAEWMLVHEYPYLEKPEILEFPNETWAAQDMRKSDILAHAASYAPEPLRQRLLAKSRFFFEACIDQLRDFETRDLTRPIVIIMTNGMVHMDVFFQAAFSEEIASRNIDFSIPKEDSQLQKNHVLNQIIRLKKVVKNTSFRKELHWIRQRLESRI